jgi:hypothetical protein
MAFYIILSSNLPTYTQRKLYANRVRSARKTPGIRILLHLFLVSYSLSEKFKRYIKVPNLMEQMPFHAFGFLKVETPTYLSTSKVLLLGSTISKRHEWS